MVLPFIIFFLVLITFWQHPDTRLTDPNSPFNEFQKPVNWTFAYSFWHVLPTLPFMIWPVPIALWLYRHPPTLLKGIGVAMSFPVFLFTTYISMFILSFGRAGGRMGGF